MSGRYGRRAPSKAPGAPGGPPGAAVWIEDGPAGPARAPPMRRGRTAATWRPGPVAGAAPSRAGWDGGGPAGPGGGARGPLRRATGGTPHPRAMRGHPLAVPTRNGRRRGGPPLWVPVLLHRGSQSGQSADRRPPTVPELVPRPVGGRGRHAPSAGPRGGPARTLWCGPCRRATGGGVARIKKIASPTAQGTQFIQYQGPTPQSLGSGLRPSDHGRRNALLHLYYSIVSAKNPDYLDFWQYMYRLCQYCCILLPNRLQTSVTATAIRAHAPGAVCALLWRGPPRGVWRGVASAGALPPFWGPLAPSPPSC